MIHRNPTHPISVGALHIGGTHPIVVQSMCNTKTTDVEGTLAQIQRLVDAGCEMVRLAVRDEKDVTAFAEISRRRGAVLSPALRNGAPTAVPLIADIHFDARLAMAAIDAGADKIRLNPGNTKDFWQAVEYAKLKQIPIRIGFNSGSSSGFDYSILEKLDYAQVILAAKSSDVLDTIEAYRALSKITRYPLHIGVTEAGTLVSGSIKSAVGIGTLLAEGIGDTIRVSLAGDPVKEVDVAYKILGALGLRKRGVEIIACPTCGRTDIDVEKLAMEVETATRHILRPLKIAVMGCAVNGPGEARHADFGIAGGNGEGLIFAGGKVIKKIQEDKLLETLLSLIDNTM